MDNDECSEKADQSDCSKCQAGSLSWYILMLTVQRTMSLCPGEGGKMLRKLKQNCYLQRIFLVCTYGRNSTVGALKYT